MGTGFGSLLFRDKAKHLPGSHDFRRVLHQQVWRRLPVRARRNAFHAITSLLAPRIDPSATPSAPFIVVGMLRHTCGLGASARLCYEALLRAAVPVFGIDITAGIGQPITLPGYRFEDGRHLLGHGTLIIHINAHMMPAVLQVIGRRILAQKHSIGVWHWELPRVPEAWRIGVKCCHQVWVSSVFTAEAVRPILGPEQALTVVHHACALGGHTRDQRKRRGDEIFTVLSIFELGSSAARKNGLAVIEAFRRAFGVQPKVRLILKIGTPHANPAAFQRLREAARGLPDVEIITSYLTDDEMAALHRRADVYLTLPRSEGFGLTMVEAMLAGVPVVAPAWSGQADFLSNITGIPVAYSLVPARDADGIYDMPETHWAEPDIDDAAAALVLLRRDEKLRLSLGASAHAFAYQAFSGEAYVKAVAKPLCLQTE